MRDLIRRFLTSHYHADAVRLLRFVTHPGASVLSVCLQDVGILSAVAPARGAHAMLPNEPLQKHPEDGYPCLPLSELIAAGQTWDYIVLNDILGQVPDVQEFIRSLAPLMHPASRLVSLTPSRAWQPLFKLAEALRLRKPRPEANWISVADLWNLMELGEMDIIKISKRCLMTAGIPLLAPFCNRVLVHLPGIRHLACYNALVARPASIHRPANPSLSVIVPARNEAGNIEAAIQRIPDLGAFTELIFVEGGSSDNTWEVLHQMAAKYGDRRRIKIARQPGKGKNDAVKTGFALAEGDLLTIVDADLTMPPEELPKFYDAIAKGKCEFANGSRLVYPMENQAMRFMNMLGNHFFALAFSWLLGQRLKDTLCGTKMFYRADYLSLDSNRAYFGDFDPFGDFDLLFGAAKLHLKIRDIPIHYKARVYGETNISRWTHGAILLRMVMFALHKLKFV